ncbi:response regulator [Aquipuribacter sp. SD81]|uniref:response regulator n=1 Tax=Aquipuribacter sp. SD81 TaxID=3127703 RepID=UPI00301A1B3B
MGTLRGVVADDRAATRRVLAAVLTRCGLDNAGESADGQELSEVIARSGADVAVVTVPMAGLQDLASVSALHRRHPHCRLVLVSPFRSLAAAARAAGATALVADDDLPALVALLSGLLPAQPSATAAGSLGTVEDLPSPRPGLSGVVAP